MENYVECAICNKKFKMLSITHLKQHDIHTTADYVKLYPNSPTMSEYTRHRYSVHATKHNNSRKGVPRSEEVKLKIRNKTKGRQAHNKGVPMSEEQKLKLSRAKTGLKQTKPRKPLTQEQKDNISRKLTGRKIPREIVEKSTKARMESFKNKPKKVKSIDYETIECAICNKKLRMMNTRHSLTHGLTLEEYVKLYPNSKIITDFTVNKFSNSRKKYSDNLKGKPLPVQTIRRMNEAGNKSTLLFIEKNKHLIEKLNIKYIKKLSPKMILFECIDCNTEIPLLHRFFSIRFREKICKTCYPEETYRSKNEIGIVEYIKELLPDEDIMICDRKLISPQELDIYIPSKNLAIEYCGIYWHSTNAGKSEDYHYNKYKKCRDKNVTLLTIFDCEYKTSKDIIHNKIKESLGLGQYIAIGNHTIKKITKKEAVIFIKNHDLPQNKYNGIFYGLFVDNMLISVVNITNETINHFSYIFCVNFNEIMELFVLYLQKQFNKPISIIIDNRFNYYNFSQNETIQLPPVRYFLDRNNDKLSNKDYGNYIYDCGITMVNKMAGAEGIEPTTFGFGDQRSTS